MFSKWKLFKFSSSLILHIYFHIDFFPFLLNEKKGENWPQKKKGKLTKILFPFSVMSSWGRRKKGREFFATFFPLPTFISLFPLVFIFFYPKQTTNFFFFFDFNAFWQGMKREREGERERYKPKEDDVYFLNYKNKTAKKKRKKSILTF